MAKSAAVCRDLALMALKADEEHWTEGAALEAIISYAWDQLLYRRGPPELFAILAELTETLSEDA